MLPGGGSSGADDGMTSINHSFSDVTCLSMFEPQLFVPEKMTDCKVAASFVSLSFSCCVCCFFRKVKMSLEKWMPSWCPWEWMRKLFTPNPQPYR